MGLDIFDAMKAAGAGLGAYAEKRKEDDKATLLKDLEAAKIKAEEEKERRREDIDRLKVHGEPSIVTKEGGLLYKRYYNNRGEILSETPVDPYERDKIDRDVAKENLNLESIVSRIGSSEAAAENSRLNAQLTGKKLGSFDREQTLQEDNLLARTEAARAATERARVSTAKDTPDRSTGTLVNLLLTGTTDLQKQYEGVLSAEDIRRVAEATVNTAREQKKDARLLFVNALKLYEARRRGKSDTMSSD